ncbi:hypothetical protein KJ708_10075 [bacterium]|nr:hypothetical protein [bacterium]MBU1917909.1 hypothetical protein [bacterium]
MIKTRKKQYASLTVKVLLLILCFSLSTACLTGGGANSIGGTSSTIEPISETESNLYESEGTFSIPVTIAKLQGPIDVQKVSMELTDDIVAPSIKAAQLPYVEMPTGGYRIIGAAESVDENTAYVLFINSLTKQQVIQPVEEDGSFEATIPAIEGTSIVMVAMDATQTYGSPPIAGSYNKSVVTFNLTLIDDNVINTRQQLILDRRWVYFSVLNSIDGTYSIFRRNLNGILQLIATGFQSEPRHLSVSALYSLAVITNSGRVYFVPYKANDDGIGGSYVNKVFLYDFGEALNDSDDPTEPPSAKVAVTEQGVFVYTQPFLNDESTDPQEYFLTFIDRATKEATGLVSNEEFRTMVWGDGRGSIRYIALQLRNENPNTPNKFFSINLDDGVDAWDNAVFLNNHVAGASVRSLASSAYDHIIFVDRIGPMRRFFQYDEGHLPLKFMQQNIHAQDLILPWIVLDPLSEVDNAKIATCKIDTEDSNNNELIFIELNQGEKNSILSLTSSDFTTSCNGSYSMSAKGIIAFYQKILLSDGAYSAPQLTIINTNIIQPDEMEEVNIVLD